jgi:hypothetical protein
MSEIRFSIETTYERGDGENVRRVTDRYTLRGPTYDFESDEIGAGDGNANVEEATVLTSLIEHTANPNNTPLSTLGAFFWFAEVAIDGFLEHRMLAQALRDSNDQNEIRRDGTKHIEVSSEDYEEKGDGKDEKCTICSDKFKGGEKISELSCHHTFHQKCIEEWGHYKAECPLCKKSIPLKKENLATDKDVEEDKTAMER